MLERIFVPDPAKRLTISEILAHPWMLGPVYDSKTLMSKMFERTINLKTSSSLKEVSQVGGSDIRNNQPLPQESVQYNGRKKFVQTSITNSSSFLSEMNDTVKIEEEKQIPKIYKPYSIKSNTCFIDSSTTDSESDDDVDIEGNVLNHSFDEWNELKSETPLSSSCSSSSTLNEAFMH